MGLHRYFGKISKKKKASRIIKDVVNGLTQIFSNKKFLKLIK